MLNGSSSLQAWAGYRAFGLAEVYAPSLYHPYYLCLGTHCNCAFDPPPADLKGNLHGGIGAAVDALRNASGLPPPPGPPYPPGKPGGEPCQAFPGYGCHRGQYCWAAQQPHFAYSGSEDLHACEAKCTTDPTCTCFIHTSRPNPPLFAACKLLTAPVAALNTTQRGYSAYVRSSLLQH